MIKRIKNSKRYLLHIGMKDKEKLEQLCSTKEFIEMVSDICSNYRIEFTMGEVYGGCISSNGKFICENSLVLSIMGLNKKEVFKLAKELKEKLNQEAIMISIEKPKIFNLE